MTTPIRFVEAGRRSLNSLDELWEFRELFWAFAVRDLKVRYRQAIIGGLWAILQPLMKLVAFSIIFSSLRAAPVVEGSNVPYSLTAFCGLILWEFFAAAVRDGGDSLVNQRHMISKIYFPRLILPCSVLVTASVDLALSSILLIAMMAWYGSAISWTIVFVPIFLGWLVAVALAGGIMFSCLNALYRDIRFVVPFLIQMGMLASPAIYEYRAVVTNPRWQWIVALNPLVSIIEGFRAALLGSDWPSLPMLLSSGLTTILVLLMARFVYNQVEHSIADRI